MNLNDWLKFAEWLKGSSLSEAESTRVAFLVDRKKSGDEDVVANEIFDTLGFEVLDLYRRLNG